ncbi:aquaporin-10 [Trichonephila clavipes]|nr:aquaporin-10 [Trichonephila clavipes]
MQRKFEGSGTVRSWLFEKNGPANIAIASILAVLLKCFRDYNYFWVPVVGPHIGAIIGIWAYKLLVELHWPVDSYDFANPTEVKTNGEFKKKDDLPYVDKKRILAADGRKVEE